MMPNNAEDLIRADIRSAIIKRGANYCPLQNRLQIILAEETLRLHNEDQYLAVSQNNVRFWKMWGRPIKGFLLLALSIPMFQIIWTNGEIFMNGFQSIYPVLATVILTFVGMAAVGKWEKENGFWKLENISDTKFKLRFAWIYHESKTSKI